MNGLMEPFAAGLFNYLHVAAAMETAERTGYDSTGTTAPIPPGWVEVTRARMVAGVLTFQSYMGPLLADLSMLVVLEIAGRPVGFPKNTWAAG